MAGKKIYLPATLAGNFFWLIYTMVVKGDNIQKKKWCFTFVPVSVDEHQPLQTKMISKMISIEYAKDCDSNCVASSKYRDNEIRKGKKTTKMTLKI